MKKFISILLLIMMVFTLGGCGKKILTCRMPGVNSLGDNEGLEVTQEVKVTFANEKIRKINYLVVAYIDDTLYSEEEANYIASELRKSFVTINPTANKTSMIKNDTYKYTYNIVIDYDKISDEEKEGFVEGYDENVRQFEENGYICD